MSPDLVKHTHTHRANYVRELWYLQKRHTEHKAVAPVKLGKGWYGLSSRVGLFFNEASMAVIMIE